MGMFGQHEFQTVPGGMYAGDKEQALVVYEEMLRTMSRSS